MSISHGTFKQVLAQWASGVTVVTSRDEHGPEGLTVSSFSSVSLDPPLVLVSVHLGSDTLRAIEASQAFAVNVLAAGQVDLGRRFAGLLPGVVDRFDGLVTTPGVTGSPVLPDALAVLECRVWRMVEAGDHRVIIGEVTHAAARDGEPLLYHARQWRTLADVGVER